MFISEVLDRVRYSFFLGWYWTDIRYQYWVSLTTALPIYIQWSPRKNLQTTDRNWHRYENTLSEDGRWRCPTAFCINRKPGMFLLNRITRDQLDSFVFVGGGRNKVIGTISPPSLSTCRETKSVCCLTTETSTNVFFLPSWPDRPPQALFFLTACKLSPHVSARRTLANHGAYLSNPAARRKAVYVKTSVRIRRQGRGSSPRPPPPHPAAARALQVWPSTLLGRVGLALSLAHFGCASTEKRSLRETVMRCQLDSSQLVTGCTWGVSVSLTHSHMLPPLPSNPVLISQLGHVMLASHSLCLFVCVCLSCSPSTHLSSLVEDHPPQPPKTTHPLLS